jgi:ketosteroid isomerase-like protein
MVMRALVLSLMVVLASAGCANQPHLPIPPDGGDGLRSGPLFDELARMDSVLFDASFVSCDAAKANAIFADDVEFYHDQDGLSVGEQVRENTRRLTASCPRNHGVTRTIVPNSLRVYPIKGYGAVQVGVHRFDERGAATATVARFVSVWHFQDGRWRLARVLSLDHRAVPPLPRTPSN